MASAGIKTISGSYSSVVVVHSGTYSYANVLQGALIQPNSGTGSNANGMLIVGAPPYTPFTLVNAGSIIGYTGYAGASGVLVNGVPATIQNSGTISGPAFGIRVSADPGAVTLVNSGLVANTSSTATYNNQISAAVLYGVRYVTNTSTGVIGNRTSEDAIKVGASPETILNYGTINGSIAGFKNNYGVYTTEKIINAGTINGATYLQDVNLTNTSTGVMTSSNLYIKLDALSSAHIYNAGTIKTTVGTRIYGSTTIVNTASGYIGNTYGSPRSALDFHGAGHAGNSTVNNAGRIVSGGIGIYSNPAGAYSLTITNTGTITGNSGVAVKIASAQNLQLEVGASAVFNGLVEGSSYGTATLELLSSASTGTITGFGTSFTNFGTITFDPGAAWQVKGTAAGLADGTTITNFGLTDTLDITDAAVARVGYGSGLLKLYNASNTQIGSLTLAGSAAGQFNANQFALTADGTGGTSITQPGLIAGYVTGPVTLAAGATTITSTGTVQGGSGAGVVSPVGVTGSLVNAGHILSSGVGVSLAGQGTISNLSSGDISGTQYGILATSGPISITNAGTISGGTDAIKLAAGVANRVVVTPGATFSGIVDGGGAGTLELASAASTGTISGIGTSFVNFGTIAVDANADWSLTGDTTIATGVTLDDGGVLSVNGTLRVAGTISNASGNAVTFTGTNNRLILAPGATLTGTVDGGTPANSVVELTSAASTGTLSAGLTNFGTIAIDAGAAWVLKGGATSFAGESISGFTSADTFDITNAAVTRLGMSGGVLSLYDASNINLGSIAFAGAQAGVYPVGIFALASDGAGGTDITAPGLITGTVSQNITLSASAIALTGTARLTAASYSLPTILGVYPTSAPGGIISGTTVSTSTVVNAGYLRNGNNYDVHLLGGGYVNNSGTMQAYRPVALGAAGTVVNSGTLRSPNYYTAVLLSAGGLVHNLAGGLITALKGPSSGGAGVVLSSGGTVSNAGTIISAANYGVLLEGPGTLTNAAGGQITGKFGVDATVYSTIDNAGTIAGNITTGGGVDLLQGGAITNATTGLITGYRGVVMGATGSVYNAGSIASSNYYAAVSLAAGGTITNAATGRITANAGGGGHSGTGVYVRGSGTIINAGSIGSGANQAIELYNSGLVNNEAGGIISGTIGVVGRYGASTVDNAGTITGAGGIDLQQGGAITNAMTGLITGYRGVVMGGAPGSVYNAGSIASSNYYAAVSLAAGGTITNAATGRITANAGGGGHSGVGVYVRASGTIINAGSIGSGVNQAIDLYNGGLVTNEGGGIIAGTIGVVGRYGTTTIDNAGTITGSGGVAVKLNTSQTNRVIVSPGAVFNGTVDGGTATGATLELASAAAAGTISGLGTSFIDFGSIAIDPGAAWTIAGTTAALTDNVINFSISGFTSADTLDITDMAATRVNFAAGDLTLYNAGNTRLGSIAFNGSAASSYAASQFTLTPDGAGGTFIRQPGLITGTLTSAVTLSTPVTTIASTGNVSVGSGTAISGPGGTFWTVTNAGIVSAPTGTGIYVPSGGSITNEAGGTISGSTALGIIGGGTVVNAGTLIGTNLNAITFVPGATTRLVEMPGAVIQGNVDGGTPSLATLELGSAAGAGTISGLGTSFLDFGTIVVDSGASWALTGSNTIAVGGTLTDLGTISGSGSLTNDGTITTDPSSIVYSGTITGSGTIQIGAGSYVAFNGGVAATQNVAFLANTGTLALGAPSSFLATVQGIVSGDIIDLTTIAPTGTLAANLQAGNLLDITQNATTIASIQLDPTQSFLGDFFHAAADGAGIGITENTVPCFCPGTLIATESGEVPVEQLVIGDRVRTADGRLVPIRWIGRRSYARRFALGQRHLLPVCIRAGALDGRLPLRDLHVSPLHAFLLDGILIPAGSLINGVSITQATDVAELHYIHIELPRHDILLAEGAEAESFVDDGGRAIYHNAAEYHALYPDAVAEPAIYCAPRHESGPAVDQVWRRIAALAGIDAGAAGLGTLRGYLDEAEGNQVRGWAQHSARPELPVALDVLLGEKLVAQVLANRFRGDLAEAGVGDGHHGFEVTLPFSFSREARRQLRVRRAIDGMELPPAHAFALAS